MVYIVFLKKKNHVHTCIVMSSNYSCNMRFIEINNLYQIMKYLLLTGEYYWSHRCWGERSASQDIWCQRHVWKEGGGGAQYCSMKLTFKVVGKQNKSGFSICVLLRSCIQNVDLFVRQSLFKLNLFPMFDVFAYLMCSPQHTTPFDLLPLKDIG